MPAIKNFPAHPTAAIVFADGQVLWGIGFGAMGQAVGELCFNTALTGYQEILSDPSYAEQIITFTFPHIGNVGANPDDHETHKPLAKGLVVREVPTAPSNWRAVQDFSAWLAQHHLIGVAGVDTRTLVAHIRQYGSPQVVIAHAPDGVFNLQELQAIAGGWAGLNGLDLAKDSCCAEPYSWNDTTWSLTDPQLKAATGAPHVVAIDYGAKHNILRHLIRSGAKVTVVPAMASAEEILALKPDGVFLSNGPGDPAATAGYAVPTIRALVKADLPIFGICLGHQLLALALGGQTRKMAYGHRGANHPVKNLLTNTVEITSQNHGFEVIAESLPLEVETTHLSLFDGTHEGMRLKGKPVFSVQYHPESSPGPHDSHYLFEQFFKSLSS